MLKFVAILCLLGETLLLSQQSLRLFHLLLQFLQHAFYIVLQGALLIQRLFNPFQLLLSILNRIDLFQCL